MICQLSTERQGRIDLAQRTCQVFHLRGSIRFLGTVRKHFPPLCRLTTFHVFNWIASIWGLLSAQNSTFHSSAIFAQNIFLLHFFSSRAQDGGEFIGGGFAWAVTLVTVVSPVGAGGGGGGGVALWLSLLNSDLQQTFQNVRHSYEMNAKRNGRGKVNIVPFSLFLAQLSSRFLA